MPIAKQRSRTLVQLWTGILAAGGLVVIGLAPGALAGAEERADAAAAPAAVSEELNETLPAGLAAMSVQAEPSGAKGVTTAPAYMSPQLKLMLSQSSKGLTVVERKSGRVSMHLQGRFLRAAFAYVDADGKVVTSCQEQELQPASAMPAGSEGKE